MNMAKRVSCRLALVGFIGIIGSMGLAASSAVAAAPPEKVFPESTVFLLKLSNVKSFGESFRKSQYGRLWNDPSMKEFRDELTGKLADATKALKDKIGVSLKELIELPQGALAIAAVGRSDPKLPVALAIMADAGENAAKMADVLARATKQAEEAGTKTSTETASAVTFHILKAPAQKGEDDKSVPPPPLIWAQSDTLFFIGSDLDVVKDLVASKSGREKSVASVETFTKTQAKVDGADAQVIWYLDATKLTKLVLSATAKGNEAQAQQTQVIVNELGLNGLKSAGGSFSFGSGKYDSLSKTFFFAPKPVEGLLKLFSLPTTAIKPESWVPASAVSYQSINWDLDNAYKAIEEIVNKFQPGILDIVSQQLVGPNGGAPLSFEKDIFGPLGDRITVVTDFKKPIKEDSQRMLLAVALEDSKAFQDTLVRIMEIAQASPKKREFQGTTIYDFDLPNMPNQGALKVEAKGSVSVAIAKDCLFVTSEPTLLEQVLRSGNTPLAENAAYLSVSKEFPEKISGMTFYRPEETARVTYEQLKSGAFEKAMEQAAASNPQLAGKDMPKLSKVVPIDKLPEFSVLAKYLPLGGSYSIMDDDGLTQTGFTLRPAGP